MPEISGSISRRSVLKAAGTAVVGGAVAGTVLNSGVAADTDWAEASSPIEKTINDVVYTVDGPYAVGEGGYVLGRNNGSWEVEVSSGPNASNNPLTAVDVTDDGKRIYFVGGSGAVGAYDVEEGVKYDYTGATPDGTSTDKTSTWEAVAVSGTFDNEQLIAANGSGETLDGAREEQDDEMCLVWGSVTEPAGGSTIPGLDFADDNSSLCYGIDTSQQAFKSPDLNDTWTNIGVENASVAFYDVTGSTSVLYVAGGSGTVYRRDCDCGNWTPIDAGQNDLLSIARFDDGDTEDVMASASGGYVYERTPDGWRELSTPVTADLNGIAYPTAEFRSSLDDPVDVAVGSSGAIIER